MEKRSVRFTKEQIRGLKRLALEKKLKGADVLNEFTDDQMMESFNGAGSSADSEWKRKLFTRLLKKKLPAILVHDMAYRKGGTKEDFKRVNEEPRDNIVNSDGDKDSIWWNFVGRKAKEYSDSNGRPGRGVA